MLQVILTKHVFGDEPYKTLWKIEYNIRHKKAAAYVSALDAPDYFAMLVL